MDFSLENRHRCIQALALQCSLCIPPVYRSLLYTSPDPTHLPWPVIIKREGLRRFTAEKELFSVLYPRVDHLLLQGLVILTYSSKAS